MPESGLSNTGSVNSASGYSSLGISKVISAELSVFRETCHRTHLCAAMSSMDWHIDVVGITNHDGAEVRGHEDRMNNTMLE